LQYINRRCLTKHECYDLNNHSSTEESIPSKEHPFIPFEGKCLQECPQRYSKSGTGHNMTCTKCGDKCLKRCTPRIIDSIATAQTLKGCSIVEGALEIQIRGTTKNADVGRNIVKELEASLVDIIEIDHYLKIARSHPILSLSFLKNLKRINGNQLETGKNAIMVWENQNLEELWDEMQHIEIKRGQLFFYYNPKLCFDKIEKLARKSVQKGRDYKEMIANYETAKLSNGDKTPCNVTLLNVTVQQVFPQAALLEWQPIFFGDDRKLLNYVVFYITAPYANITLWEGRDACGNDGWNVEDVNDFTLTAKVTQPLTKLEPYTQYAYYVKAYTVATEGTGAQSLISYFTTKPDMPDRVKKVKVTALSSDKLVKKKHILIF
jgi:insulin receptor